MTNPIEEEMTELHDANFPRVDLVGKAANGTQFLIAKARDEGYGANLFEAAVVRDLVAKSGTPDSLKEASMTAPTEAVVKENDDLDASTVLAEPEAGVSGSETMPGSPAWEATDAATARKWTGILSRAKNALEVLSDREGVESSTGGGDADDMLNSFDLQDASCAIDYAISVLAPYAVAEQVEADLAGEGVELVGKSMATFDTGALEELEGFASVVKAGRSLSAANEAKIRGAVDSLQSVLTSLPAPTDDVAKQKGEPAVTDTQTTDPAIDAVLDRVRKSLEAGEPVTIHTGHTSQAEKDAAEVAKAKGDPQVAVYDANGKLVGTIDQADLNPIASAAPAEAPKPTDPASLAPAPAAEVGTPVAAAPAAPAPVVAKEAAPAADPAGDPEDKVSKSTVVDIVKAALEEQAAAHADVLKGLREELDALKAPAPSKVLFNGAPRPMPRDARGMDEGAGTADIAKAADLRSKMENTGDATEREAIAKELNGMAATALTALHAARPAGRG